VLGEAGLAAGDRIQDTRSRQGSQHLGHNIGKEFFCREAVAGDQSCRYCGVQMAARDVANRQCLGKQSQTEGKSDARESRIPLL